MLTLSDNSVLVGRMKAGAVWSVCFLLVLLDLLFDLPGPIGFMCTLVLANEWMRALPGISIFSLVVLSSSIAAGFLHQSEAETWWTRMVVVGIAAAVLLTLHHPKLRTSWQAADAADDEPEMPLVKSWTSLETPLVTADGSSFENRSRLNDLIDDGDVSGVTRVMARVPLKVRLIDSGAFSLQVASEISQVVDSASSLELGCQQCVSLGLMTAYQAEHVVQGLERKLRIGRYTLVDILGRGAMGVVYRAIDRDRMEFVALKLFRDRRNNLMLIRREMAVIQELAHPNIVTAFEVGQSDRQHFIAMEIVEGETLLELVRREGPLTESRAVDYTMQLAQAISQAHHRQILHRDIKPGNVMLSAGGICKLMDMGLSRPPESLKEYDSICVGSSSIYGTIGFVSPEQANLSEEVDHRADIYGLGSTLFYLLTGKSHVRGNTAVEKLKNLTVNHSFRDPQDFNLQLPLVEVLEKMLAYDANQRYQSAEDLIHDLRELMVRQGQTFDEALVLVVVLGHGWGPQSVGEQLRARGNRSLRVSPATTVEQVVDAITQHQSNACGPIVVVVDLSSIDESLTPLFDLSCVDLGFIVLTADDSPSEKQRWLGGGAMGYVLKRDDYGRELEQVIFVTRSRLTKANSTTRAIKVQAGVSSD